MENLKMPPGVVCMEAGRQEMAAFLSEKPEARVIRGRLEDLGWYVVDNLPPSMLPTMVDLGARSAGAVPRIAVVVDVRGGSFFDHLRDALAELEEPR